VLFGFVVYQFIYLLDLLIGVGHLFIFLQKDLARESLVKSTGVFFLGDAELQRLWDSTSLFGFVGMRQRG
jgi:hypothetical protein